MRHPLVLLVALTLGGGGCLPSFDPDGPPVWDDDDDATAADDDDSGGDDDSAAGAPDIAVTPNPMNIQATVGSPSNESMVIHNVGDEDLDVYHVIVFDSPGHVVEVFDWYGTIDPGASHPMQEAITITCGATGPSENVIRVQSNDPDGDYDVSVQVTCGDPAAR